MTIRTRCKGLALPMLATAALAGCATQPPRQTSAPPPRPGLMVQDTAYIAQVERKALRRGLQVQWINPPTRRTPRAD